ncbi:hypothetical protein ACJIZ3_023652 [Penstemon smallii]|uniref:Uncharacterized protein n=1 Tax=Penstemon smallii TaxID=265156 RepID=A0ABD3RJZ1_9LAMI
MGYEHKPVNNLLDAVETIKPKTLIGTSGADKNLCHLIDYIILKQSFLEANETRVAEIEKMKLIHILFGDEQCR